MLPLLICITHAATQCKLSVLSLVPAICWHLCSIIKEGRFSRAAFLQGSVLRSCLP